MRNLRYSLVVSNEGESFLTPDDLEREREYFQLIYDLQVENRSRYEKQAELLIEGGEFSITLNDSLLLYTLEGGGCSFRISRDGGFDFCKLGWTNLGGRKAKKLETLIGEFANSEARTILNR